MFRCLMYLVEHILHRKVRRVRQAQREEALRKVAHETALETQQLRSTIKELKAFDDPLAQLMRTLRPKKRHGNVHQ